MTARTTRRRWRSLSEACRLLRFEPWPRQAELLAAVERGPRVHAWALGRRSGKTTLAALVAVWDALLRPGLDAKLRPGERRYAVAVATNLRQARLIVAAARTLVERSPVFAPLIESVTDDEMAFATGTSIAAFPCTSRGGRGWPVSCLVLDELAHFVDTEGNSAAESVWRALVPSTLQFGQDARIIASSTPYGSDGLFASVYAQAASGELADGVAHHATTAQANPTIDPAALQAEEARDPEAFKSEYLAEFIGGGMSFLDPERITDAVADRDELEPGQAVGWVAGLDPAFSSDPFGLALVGRDPGNPGRLLLGLARAWRPSKRKAVSFEERRQVEDAVLAEVAETCLAYRARVVTDQYAAPAIVEALRRRGLHVQAVPMTATSKTAAFSELRARLNAGTVELYEHPDLLAELRRLRTRFTAGAASVVNPRVGGSHGDLAQALALSTFAHRGGFSTGAPFVGGQVNDLYATFGSHEPVQYDDAF
jgi:phage terminase large subunit-like protein